VVAAVAAAAAADDDGDAAPVAVAVTTTTTVPSGLPLLLSGMGSSVGACTTCVSSHGRVR
jgi:hypothetical protein